MTSDDVLLVAPMRAMHCRAGRVAALAVVVLLGCASPPHPPSAQDAFASNDGASSSPSNQYPEVLNGVWLIGRFDTSAVRVSWLRLPTPPAPEIATPAWVLAGADIPGNLPLWKCQGKTTWTIGTNRAIYLDLDALGCGSAPIARYGYHFTNFTDPTGQQAPAGATLVVTVQDRDTSEELLGYRFPPNWCDAAMTKCPSPF